MLTMIELYQMGLGPLFEHPPEEPGQGGGGVAVQEPPAGGANVEGGDGGDTEEGGEEPTQPARKSFEDRLKEIEETDDLSELVRGDSDEPDLREVVDEGGEVEEPSGEGESEDFELPDGWKRTESGKIQRPNGEFASKAEIDALRTGEQVETVTTSDPEGEEEEEGEGEDDGPLVVAVPGRTPDDPDLELPLDAAALEELGISPTEARERVQQLKNDAMRRGEFNRQMEQVRTDRAELEFIESQLAEHPEDYILGHVAPDIRGRVAERILATMPDDQFEAVLTKVAGWERNPVARREEAVALREQQIERAEQLRSGAKKTTKATDAAVAIGRQVNSVIPETWPDEKADRFFRFAIVALQDHFASQEVENVDPADVPQVLGRLGVLDDFGLSADGQPTSGSAAGSSASSAGQGPAGAAEIERAQRAGEEAKKRLNKRKDAAATAPAGAGSSVLGGLKVPKGQTFEERMGWLEKTLGIRK